jgi:hypothetical protein
MAYIQEVDYKGLNGSVISAIYHMTQNINYIRRQIVYKHHAYIMPTTHQWYLRVSAIQTLSMRMYSARLTCHKPKIM